MIYIAKVLFLPLKLYLFINDIEIAFKRYGSVSKETIVIVDHLIMSRVIFSIERYF